MQQKQLNIFKLYLLPACFLGMLFFHFADQIFDFTPDGENTENRILAEKPVFKIDNLDAFPVDFDHYFNDHFKWRNQLITANNRINFLLQKSAISKEVVLGKNGWLFHSNGIDLFRGKTQFNDDELKKIRKELLFRNEFIERKGGKYYLVIVPQKQSVYPEYLPDHIRKINAKTSTENLIEFLHENTDLSVINLVDSLKLKKETALFPLFYKTDHHWNSYGALLGIQSVLYRIQKDFSNLDTLEVSAYEFELQSIQGRVTAQMLKLENELRDEDPLVHYNGNIQIDTIPNDYAVPENFPYKNEYVIKIRSSKSNAPKMMMVRESFAVQLIPEFSKYFSESVYVFDGWHHRLNPEIVEREKPEIYVQMIYEKLLVELLKNQSSD